MTAAAPDITFSETNVKKQKRKCFSGWMDGWMRNFSGRPLLCVIGHKLVTCPTLNQLLGCRQWYKNDKLSSQKPWVDSD